MLQKTRLSQIILLLLTSVLLIWVARDRIWSGSADLAHHYSLVARLTEYGYLPSKVDPSLGEMQTYPRMSHFFAAWIGKFFGSPIIGMQLVVLLAVVILWAAIGWILWSLPRMAARQTFGILIVLLILNGTFFHLELFGDEIVGNYFYSQLVAQAVMLLAVGVVLGLEKIGISRLIRYIFLIISALFVESIHLLPALELFSLFGVLALIDLFQLPNGKRQSSIFITIFLLAVGAVLAIKHPTFKVMRTISENNGTLPLHYISNLYALSALALLVGAISFVFILYEIRLNRRIGSGTFLALKYVGAFGVVISCLCLLQIAALAKGQGSEYACRKYVFALYTQLLIIIALLPIIFLKFNWFAAHKSQLHKIGGSIFDCASFSLLVSVSFLAILPMREYLSVRKLVLLEHQLNMLNTSVIPHVLGKSTYAVSLPGMPNIVNYMFSIGIFKAPRTDNAYDILQGRVLSEPNVVGALVTSPGAQPYNQLACKNHSTVNSLVVIDGSCFEKEFPRRTLCSGWFHFTTQNWMASSALTGFSVFESHGAWTDGNFASFSCKMPEEKRDWPTYAQIIAEGFVPSKHQQKVIISVNGEPARTVMFSKEREQQIISFPLPTKSQKIHITLALPDAVSPEELGISSDQRKLGIYIKWVRFYTHPI